MNCTSCGKSLRVPYAFRFCPECGAATNSTAAVFFHIPVWLKHDRFVRLGALGVCGMALIGMIASFLQPGFSSPEKAVRQYYHLILDGSYGDLKDSVPTALRNEIMSTDNLKDAYIKDQWELVLEDKSNIGYMKEAEIRILEEKKNLNSVYGSLGFQQFQNDISKFDMRKGGFDAEDIKEARYIRYRITWIDEDGNYFTKEDKSTIVYKLKGRWYLTDAAELFAEICEEC